MRERNWWHESWFNEALATTLVLGPALYALGLMTTSIVIAWWKGRPRSS
jgi:hypothetical protein